PFCPRHPVRWWPGTDQFIFAPARMMDLYRSLPILIRGTGKLAVRGPCNREGLNDPDVSIDPGDRAAVCAHGPDWRRAGHHPDECRNRVRRLRHARLRVRAA